MLTRGLFTRIVAAVASLAAVGLAMPASAAPLPQLTARSTVGKTSIPTLVSGNWQSTSSGGWQAVLRTAAAPSGTTTIDASWTSPVVLTRHNRPFFASAINVDHRGISGTGVVESAVVHQEYLRLCDAATHRCGRWFGVSMMWPNEGIDLASDPFVGVTVYMNGAILECGRSHRTYVQWRARVTQTDVDVATVTMDIAAGRAAERAEPAARCPQRHR